MTQPTPEQIAQFQQDEQTRAALLQGFSSLYNNLTDYVGRLGMPNNIKLWCIMNLDQGAMWAREGIAAMQFNFQSQPPATPPVPPQESKPQDEKKEETPKETSEPKQEEKPL